MSDVGKLQVSQRLEQRLGALRDQPDFSRGLEKLKTLLAVFGDFLRGSGRAAQKFAVLLARLHHFRDRFEQSRIFLIAAQPARERKIAGADEQDVDAWRRPNFVDVFYCPRLFADLYN